MILSNLPTLLKRDLSNCIISMGRNVQTHILIGSEVEELRSCMIEDGNLLPSETLVQKPDDRETEHSSKPFDTQLGVGKESEDEDKHDPAHELPDVPSEVIEKLKESDKHGKRRTKQDDIGLFFWDFAGQVY